MSRKQAATKQARPPLPSPSSAEKQAIDRATLRVGGRSPRMRVEVAQDKDGAMQFLGGVHNDHEGWLARLQDVFGSRGTDFAAAQLNRLMSVCKDADGKIDGVKLNGLLAMVEGAEPQNEIQAALAVQMALTHTAVQTILQRAMRVDQIPQFDSASNSAVKLLRTFTMQAETLAKLQRGGEQVVKVVHVHPGGQAIVGNVVSGASGVQGGGVAFEKSNQPHAPDEAAASTRYVTAQRGAEMPRQDAGRMPVPVSSRQR